MPTKDKSPRIPVLKTYKLFIGGQFPRTESGRYYVVAGANGKPMANACLASRKDLRDAVSAARGACSSWQGKTAYNRGQILYRMAEVVETRRVEFEIELCQTGSSKQAAKKEVSACIDTLIHYAGWCDKYQQLFSTVNPVAGAYFNFSVPEPMGVVGIISSLENALLSIIQTMAPVIAGGNTCIILAPMERPLPAIALAEAIATSDVPGGVVNVLTGKGSELVPWLSGHMDVNAIVVGSWDGLERDNLERSATSNLKRIVMQPKNDAVSPYRILDLQEIKTTWHPIENIAPAGATY